MGDKRVQTVLGDISPNDVGVTMTHEHLTLDIENIFFTPPDMKDKGKENLAFSLENNHWINRFPNSHRKNLCLQEEHESVIEEIHFYKKNGGNTIVENTNSMGRDVEYLKKLSKATGVNIVAGAGLYVHQAHPRDMSDLSEETLCKRIVEEITVGCDGTDVKCGIIGEIGCSWPLADSEKKSLRASAQAQLQTGCPVIIHPGRDKEAPFEIIRILQEAGGNIQKTVMSHLDRTFADNSTLIEFAQLGSYCEYDLFGLEVSHYQFNLEVDMPSDAQRIGFIKHLVDEGYEDKVLIAHDIHTKHRLMKYGGHGYSHILLNVVPKMKQRGISPAVIDKMLIHNPKEWLQF